MNDKASACRLPAVFLAAAAMAVTAPCQCGLVADLTPGTVANGNSNQGVSLFGEELYFAHYDAGTGGELWKWTPTGGAQIVIDQSPGSYTTNPEGITAVCLPMGPRVVYSGFEIGHGHELYMSDGTAAGTGRVKEIRSGSSGSLPWKFINVRDRVLFEADDGVHGDELWITDGTGAGTQMLIDIAPGTLNGRPQHLVELNGKLIFSAWQAATGRELWISDGTAAGTQLLMDIRPGTATSGLYQLTRAGDYVYFAANDGVAGNSLWRIDGTTAGTEMVHDFYPAFSGDSVIDHITAVGDRVFFDADAALGLDGLYVSDGTSAGTVYLDVQAPNNLTSSGDRLFFMGYYFSEGSELWSSDGTPAGTQLVLDIYPGAQSSFPAKLTDVGNGVVFTATSPGSYGEIWFSDGTAAGTEFVCQPDPTGSYPPWKLVMCHGHLFFEAYNPAYGIELTWIETPGASTEVLGQAARPDHGELQVQNGAVPVLGSTVTFEAEPPSNHFGVLLASNPMLPLGVPEIPGLVSGGCDVTGLQLGTAVTIATALAPGWTWDWNVPSAAALEGAGLNLQMLWVHGSGGAPLFQLSNGLRLTLGTDAPH